MPEARGPRRTAVRMGSARSAAVTLAGLAALVLQPAGAAAQDPAADLLARFPDVTGRVGVFDDQLPGRLPDPLLDFVAARVDGAQKLPRSLADALHARDPGFMVLQYRLGLGLGDHAADEACRPTGDAIAILDGDDWVPEWPADPDPSWFALTATGERQYLCDWGWWLVDTDALSWRTWFGDQVAGQIERTGADGLFLDSVSPPNQLGTWSPPLPDVDEPTEEAWSRRIERWIPWIEERLGVPVVANAGAWMTSRETTDRSGGAGVMVEGFALPWSDVTHEDWALQLDRALTVTRPGRVLLAQAYPDLDDLDARSFIVGSYLLVQGPRAYVNLEVAEEPAWFPEYDLRPGPALDPLPDRIEELREGDVFVRRFRDLTVVVNPGPGEARWTPPADAPAVRLVPHGGGVVPGSGVLPAAWRLEPEEIEGALVLPPRSAAFVSTGGMLPVRVDATAEAMPSAGVAEVVQGASPQAGEAATAVHRHGQTFLTWTERADLTGERFHIHRSGTPLDAAALTEATRIATAGEGSNRVWSDRTQLDAGWGWRNLERAVIEDGADPLPADRGLLVWTPGVAGEAWYAVETVGPDGARLGTEVVGPVTETADPPRPIEVLRAADGRAHLMLQVMDLGRWNPTFHAPHEHNGRLGLDPATPGLDDALAYAYTYVVAEPAPASCPDGVVPDRLPVILELHGWGGDTYPPHLGPSDYYCALQIRPVDTSQTWWFGFAMEPDYRRGELPGPGDHIANLTEQRLLRMVADLLADPELGPRADPERVYVYGHSMGGSGTLALALRYPSVFAAAYASEPMTRYATSGDGGGLDWREDVAWKWGTVADDLPVTIDAPEGWAAGIARYAGTGVYTWQDHQRALVERRADESVPIGVAHGSRDDVIEWATQGRPFQRLLATSDRAFGAAVVDTEHTWLGYAGIPVPLRTDDSLVPFHALQAVLHESVPAIREDAAAAAWPPDDAGQLGAVTWAASWDAWDAPPVDTPASWEMSFRSVDDAEHVVSITPRRLQAFRVTPGDVVRWEVRPVGTGEAAAAASGEAVVDADGLVTVPEVVVGPSGVRLRLVRDVG